MTSRHGDPPLYRKMARVLQAAIDRQKVHGVRLRLPPERRLSSAFGVSRLTTRAALLVVAGKHPVERWVGRGAFVAADSEPDGPCVMLQLGDLLDWRASPSATAAPSAASIR
jgi:DNA-binding GntR family transcriptional regulator